MPVHLTFIKHIIEMQVYDVMSETGPKLSAASVSSNVINALAPKAVIYCYKEGPA